MIIVFCLFASLYVLGLVTSENDGAIKDIEGNDTSFEDALTPEELKAIETRSPELKALRERGEAIKEGRAVPELKVDGVVFGEAMSESDVQRFKFEGGPRGEQWYLGGERKSDRAFLACWYLAKNSVLDSDAEFNNDVYNYAGRHDNGDYLVDVYFVARNAFNAKINVVMRCAVEINEDNARVVEMFQLMDNSKSSITHTNELAQLSQETGVDIETLDTWGKAVRNFGVDPWVFYNSVKSFARNGNTTPEVVFQLLPGLADEFQKGGREIAQMYGQQTLGLDAGTIDFLLQGRKAVEKALADQKELGVLTEEDARYARELMRP